MKHINDGLDEKPGYLTLVRRNGAFRNIWFGEVISNFGDWFNIIASASLIGALGGSALELGILFVVRMLAPFLVSPLAGVLADRLSRKRIMILSDMLRALVVCCFLLVRGPQDTWLLYLLTALQASLSGFFVPARNALLPDIVSARELSTANTLSAGTYAVMLAFGAAAGGFATGILGVYETFLIDAASYCLSALLIATVRLEHVSATLKLTVRSFYRQYLDGLIYLRAHTETAILVFHKGLNALFITGGLNVLTVSIATHYFPLGKHAGLSMGILYCATGVGTGLGPIFARYITQDDEDRMRKGLIASYLISAIGLAIAAPLLSFWTVLVGLLIRGMGGGLNFVFSTQLLMTRLPSIYRGRVFGTEYAIRTMLNTMGTMAISVGLGRLFGVAGMLGLTAALALIPAALWWLWVRIVPFQRADHA